MYWKLVVVASKRKLNLKDGTIPKLQRDICRKSYCAKLVLWKKLDELTFHPKRTV